MFKSNSFVKFRNVPGTSQREASLQVRRLSHWTKDLQRLL